MHTKKYSILNHREKYVLRIAQRILEHSKDFATQVLLICIFFGEKKLFLRNELFARFKKQHLYVS